jgi:hypothetical protein
MKHDIQKKIYEETKGMTQEEVLEYYRAGARKLRQNAYMPPIRKDGRQGE